MTPSDRILSVNDHLVASDIVDGEAVIINLSNGMYFTMDKVGAEVWQLFARPRSVAGVATILAGRYGIAESAVRADLEEVVDQLFREQLVVAVQDTGAGTSDDDSTEFAIQASYSKPVLMKYTDMSEVLALDPPLPDLGAAFPKRS